jgi:uncharacterized protein
MPSSLSDRLRALGVQVGPSELKPKPRIQPDRLSDALGGQFEPTPFGEAFVITQTYPEGSSLGDSAVEVSNSLERLAVWAGDARIAFAQPEELVFLDTETTGLAGGTGTYPFLIGAGRFQDGEFVLKQFFMPDPAAESAQLAAFESFLATGSALVSFNGKAFDVPLINTRYTLQGLETPLRGMAHIDLLHLARRLWRDRLPSRTLGNLEVQILGAVRSDMDIPGWLIPQIYFDFLRDGDPNPLKNVLYHNGQDVVSLAALLNHSAGLLNDPIQNGGRYGVDLIALARLFEDMGDLEHAAQLYIHGLDHEDSRSGGVPVSLLLQALQRLALIRKRQDELEAAVELWQQAASRKHLDSFIELAKCFEHHRIDIPQALGWTNAAIHLLEDEAENLILFPALNSLQRQQVLGDLRHRQIRLQRKLEQTS